MSFALRTPKAPLGFPRDARLRASADFERCYRTGRRRGGEFLTLHFAPSDRAATRLGVTVSRKVGKAVMRHRLKRWCRESFRCWEGRALRGGLDLVAHLKPAAGAADFSRFRTEFVRLADSTPVLAPSSLP